MGRGHQASLSGLASSWLSSERGVSQTRVACAWEFPDGLCPPPPTHLLGVGPRAQAGWCSASKWQLASRLKQPPNSHPASLSLPFPHTQSSQRHSALRDCPPTRPYSSQNSGEVSEPPQPQLLAPLRTSWDRPRSQSQQPRRSRN